MTTLESRAIAGNIYPGKILADVKPSYVTNSIFGEPRVQHAVETPKHAPRDLSDSRHEELISAIKGISVSQDVRQTKMTEALPGNRDWRT